MVISIGFALFVFLDIGKVDINVFAVVVSVLTVTVRFSR